MSKLHRGLANTEWGVRGQCALALARIEGLKVHDALIRSYSQAAVAQERVLACLGLLVIDQPPPEDPDLHRLREDLAGDSFLYLRLITDDILEVLYGCQHPKARGIAKAWEGIYAEQLDY
ncbi:hypothetical protein [Streptomyces sirii]|uniref:hypothetical protein n=1 Tax=Streptomyces sirii TaxID=3127701 RepID=UPI003D36D747